MIKVINVIGARPQFIKYFPISRAIKNSPTEIEDILLHTGQHYDYSMSKVFFNEFGIKEPNYHLEAGGGSHGQQTSLILKKAEEVFQHEKPDYVIVYGDTNSTLAATLAATKLHIPIVHIEAGLRSYNKCMPEEINRVLTDHASTLLLCPTETAIKNLQKEGFSNVLNDGKLIHLSSDISGFAPTASSPLLINTGDVMYDVLQYTIKRAEEKSTILNSLKLKDKSYILLTLHRAENTRSIQKLEEAVGFVNQHTSGQKVIFPMHPGTRKYYQGCKVKFHDGIQIIDPLSYFDILMLLKSAQLLFTDSGGMQKEAYWLGIPTVTLREETEWVETVESGYNVLSKDYTGSHTSSKNESHYGDGNAAKRIITILTPINHTKSS